MKRLLAIFSIAVFFMAFSINASAFSIDFEDGVEGSFVSGISGISFLDFNGFESLYGDSRTGNYNTTSDDLGYSSLAGSYHHNGNFFIWAGKHADAQGVIVDFTNNDGTWFSTGYSSSSTFYVNAYLTDGSMVTASGASNINSPMGSLTVNATGGLFIDYVVLHDTGNYWLVDDMSGDASNVNNPVPEPATMFLFGAGLLGMAGFKKKERE